jgi:hypothetical protein
MQLTDTFVRAVFLSTCIGVSLLAACTTSVGEVAPILDEAGTDSGTSGALPDAAVDSGGSTDAAGDAMTVCTKIAGQPSEYCTLSRGKPGALTLQVREACGDGSKTTCKVLVAGMAITLSLEVEQCVTSGTAFKAAPAQCSLRAVDCAIPALGAGSYAVTVKGNALQDLAPGQLVVAADGTQTACALQAPGVVPPPVTLDAYSRACTVDTDCEAVTAGNPCEACSCSTDAIAKADLPKYQSDYADAKAKCALGPPRPDCAACLNRAVQCASQKCILLPTR